jgi:phosphoglucosamine mutase
VGELKLKLFGSSGVRGVVNVDLTPDLAARLGLAVASFSHAKTVLVARDTRVSGQMLENALVSGLLCGGARVHCLGIVPTPLLAFSTAKLKASAGVMITASHNPPQYNGVKIFGADGLAYDDESQNEIERIVADACFRLVGWREIGEAQFIDQTQHYVEMILQAVELHRRWNIVVDPGCGATHSIAPAILTKLQCNVTALNAQPDGFFPARRPEPDKESLGSLINVVKSLGADLGLAYDGDGDRVAFVDERGNFADFDRVLAAYAGYVVDKNGGGTVVTNIEASMCIDKMVEAQGGRVLRTKVGDVHVSKAMKQHKSVFGGEPCGAWIHPRFHFCPDGVLSSVLLLKALNDEDMCLAEFISGAPKFSTLRKNIACRNEVKYRVVENVEESLKSAFPNYRELSKVDGVRVDFRNGWILVRASGTEPVVRLTVEGESLKAAREIMEKGAELVNRAVGRVK